MVPTCLLPRVLLGQQREPRAVGLVSHPWLTALRRRGLRDEARILVDEGA